MPSIRHRSTPLIRYTNCRRSNCGEFPRNAASLCGSRSPARMALRMALPGHPADIPQYIGQLDIHLRQRLLHPLDVRDGCWYEMVALPDLLRGAEARCARTGHHGLNPTLLQPFGHGLQLDCSAPEVPHRLGYRVSGVQLRSGIRCRCQCLGIGMDHFQAEVFALDLPHHLAPLLAFISFQRPRVEGSVAF